MIPSTASNAPQRTPSAVLFFMEPIAPPTIAQKIQRITASIIIKVKVKVKVKVKDTVFIF